MTDLIALKAMPDRREAILLRLSEAVASCVDTGNVFRNTTNVPETKRPAIVILDADETADEGDVGRKRPANAPRIVGMTPEMYLLLSGSPDTHADDDVRIGQELNALRKAVIAAVLKDASLVALCHDGRINYEGFATGLAAGRSMEGEAGVSFTFFYVLRPEVL